MLEPIGVIAALGGISCAVRLAVLVYVGVCGEARRTSMLAYGGAVANAIVAVVALSAGVPVWSQVCAVMGVLLAAEAAAIVFGLPKPLAVYVRQADADDRRWWSEFEREFWRCVGKPPREQNPLRAAVTRRPDSCRGVVPVVRAEVKR